MTLLAAAADYPTARNSIGVERLAVLERLRSAAPRGPKVRPTRTGFAWVSLFAILTAVIAARAFGVTPVSECRATPSRLSFAPITEVKMTTSTRAPCLLSLRLGTAQVDALTITTAPQHGAVSPRGRTGVVYRPQAGFRGEDAFWFSFDGRSNQNPGAAVVRVGVTVR
jgi:hypothetical protein